MKRYGEVPETAGCFVVRSSSVVVDRLMLAKLIDRLEYWLPKPTQATHLSDTQKDMNDWIREDQRVIDAARKLLE